MKRRAWPALFDLYERELTTSDPAKQVPILMEMAQLAAERLNRGADAVELYKNVLEIDPTRGEVMDALEKYAERAKDWKTLATVLERRVDATADGNARLNVLQKLGSVYADHLSDHVAAASAWKRSRSRRPPRPGARPGRSTR